MKTKLRGILTLLLAFIVHLTFAQQKTISGTVTDQDGLPLPGVNILVQGTQTGTQTGFEGEYTIPANTGQVLVFTYLGQKQEMRTVGAQSVINVQMKEDAEALEEVVVTGLGMKREKKSLGYAAQEVKGSKISETRQMDIGTALAGKIAGVQLQGQASSTFKSSQLLLRGERGVLYIVDGIKVDKDNINPEDIETSTVLKGLAATAIYGPDARNGAIVITTKKAKSGESSIILNSSITLGNIVRLPDYQNEYGGGLYDGNGRSSAINDFSTFSFDATRHDASWASFDGQLMPQYAADESWGPRLEGQLVRHWDSWIPNDPEFGKLRPWTANPNNVKNFYKTSVAKNNSISFARGGEGYSIRANATHIDENLILENTNRKSIIASIAADFDLSDKFKLVTNFNYRKTNTLNDPTNNYGNLGANFNQWWQRQIDIDRLRNYKRDGQMVSWNMNSPTNPKPAFWNSPFFEQYENLKNEDNNSTYGKIGFIYKPIEGLVINADFKKRYLSTTSDFRTAFGGLDVPYYRERAYSQTLDEIFALATYSKKVNKFDFQIGAGVEISNYYAKQLRSQTVGGLAVPGLYNVNSSIDRPTIQNWVNEYENKAWLTKASFGYDNFLYVEGTYRTDYRSTADPESNSVSTYGISGSFIATKFIPKNDALSFLKLRVGYAEAPVFPSPYSLSQTYNIQKPYGSKPSLSIPAELVNPDLKGGERRELEYGAEFKFLRNRISLDATYYNRNDFKLPKSITLAGGTGKSSVRRNEGETTTKGLEITLGAHVIKSDNFNWNFSFNIGTLEKTVVKIADGTERNVLDSWGPSLVERKGDKWGSLYGNVYDRDDNGKVILNANGLPNFKRNENLGNFLPDVTGGFLTDFNYKNLTLSLGLDYQFGGLFYGVSRRYGTYAGLTKETTGNNSLGNPIRNTITGNTTTDYSVELNEAATNSGGTLVEGVKESDGSNASYLINPAVYYKHLRNIHEHWIEDNSYIKLRTIRLAYDLPQKIVERTPFTNVNMSLIANNVLLLYSKAKGNVDPSEIEGRERGNGLEFRDNNRYTWIENGQLPSSRTIGFNLKLQF